MEEEKQRGQNMQENGAGQGRRRRRKHRGGKKNREQNGQPVSNAQNAQNAQNGQNGKGGNGQKQGQNQPKQQPQKQNNPQNNAQNNGNKQKKGQNGGGQKPQSKDDNRPDTYAYVLDGNLYLNLTNKCSNGCDFCVRNERTSYYGNYLWLRHGDPTVEKVIRAVNGMGDLTRFKEVVFCGFGEPTYKLAEMVELCDYFHSKGLKTRLNTNGQGSLIHKRDIAPDLVGKIDFVNISLNASCKEKYQKICRSQFGEAGFDGLTEFAKACKREGIACRFSIVDCIGEEEVEACKRFAESVKIPLYVRSYITDS